MVTSRVKFGFNIDYSQFLENFKTVDSENYKKRIKERKIEKSRNLRDKNSFQATKHIEENAENDLVNNVPKEANYQTPNEAKQLKSPQKLTRNQRRRHNFLVKKGKVEEYEKKPTNYPNQ